LLAKRIKLRKRGSIDSEDRLPERINSIVAEDLCRRLSKLADTPVKDMWKALEPRKFSNSTSSSRNNHLLSTVESVNQYFVVVSFDPTATTDGSPCRAEPGAAVNGFHMLYAYEVEPLLRKVHKTAHGKDQSPYWVFLPIVHMN
jgi:hypothetical protein